MESIVASFDPAQRAMSEATSKSVGGNMISGLLAELRQQRPASHLCQPEQPNEL